MEPSDKTVNTRRVRGAIRLISDRRGFSGGSESERSGAVGAASTRKRRHGRARENVGIRQGKRQPACTRSGNRGANPRRPGSKGIRRHRPAWPPCPSFRRRACHRRGPQQAARWRAAPRTAAAPPRALEPGCVASDSRGKHRPLRMRPPEGAVCFIDWVKSCRCPGDPAAPYIREGCLRGYVCYDRW